MFCQAGEMGAAGDIRTAPIATPIMRAVRPAIHPPGETPEKPRRPFRRADLHLLPDRIAGSRHTGIPAYRPPAEALPSSSPPTPAVRGKPGSRDYHRVEVSTVRTVTSVRRWSRRIRFVRREGRNQRWRRAPEFGTGRRHNRSVEAGDDCIACRNR